MSEPECIVQQPRPFTRLSYYWPYTGKLSLQHIRFAVDKLQEEMIEKLEIPVKYLTWEWEDRKGDYVYGVVVKGWAPEISLWDCDCKECRRLQREADDEADSVV